MPVGLATGDGAAVVGVGVAATVGVGVAAVVAVGVAAAVGVDVAAVVGVVGVAAVGVVGVAAVGVDVAAGASGGWESPPQAASVVTTSAVTATSAVLRPDRPLIGARLAPARANYPIRFRARLFASGGGGGQ